MDFQVEPCCNYLCKLKDISRRLSGCDGGHITSLGAGAANRHRRGEVVRPDECFQESCEGGDVSCLANRTLDSRCGQVREYYFFLKRKKIKEDEEGISKKLQNR